MNLLYSKCIYFELLVTIQLRLIVYHDFAQLNVCPLSTYQFPTCFSAKILANDSNNSKILANDSNNSKILANDSNNSTGCSSVFITIVVCTFNAPLFIPTS